MRHRPAASITLVYLVVMLPVALIGHDGSVRSTVFVVGHVAALLAMAVAVTIESPQRPWLHRGLDWVPLLSIPFLYAELPLLMSAFGSGYHDTTVQGWERFLFGESPAATLGRAFPYRWISEPLHLAYLSYYALIYAPPAVLALRGDRIRFLEMSAAIMLAFALCFTVFTVFPVQGPRYLWTPDGVPDGPVRRLVLGLLETGSSRGAAFPSSHVAVAVVQAVLAWRFRLRGAAVIGVLTAGLAAGAVYGGFHYAVDVLAGAATGVVVAFLALRARPRG